MRDFKRSKRWIELFAFAAVTIVLLLALSYVFDPIRTGDSDRVNERDIYVASALTEEENTIDVAVLGDSEALVLLSP